MFSFSLQFVKKADRSAGYRDNSLPILTEILHVISDCYIITPIYILVA
jgi:hypothetical protein